MTKVLVFAQAVIAEQMTKRTSLFIFGAALLVSAASVLCAPARPGAPQTSSASTSTTTKKKRRVSSRSRRKARGHAQAAPTPDRIKEIQTALQKDGSYEGTPTGKWDAATIGAMKKFQDKNGFSPTGKIDAVSLNKLGLGSETAGKGAPVPAATASAPTATTPPASPADPPAKQ
jgi:peptidoglycan hydrolase-like protein with peptidoglycan-binding domain